MSLEIHYTPKAKKSLKFLYSFLADKFGKRHASKFIKNAEDTVYLLKDQPYMFGKSELGDHVRLGLIARHTSFLYEITEGKIILHFFWDNRQEPFYEYKSQ